MSHRTILFSFLVSTFFVGADLRAIIIDKDTTIDAAHSFPSEEVAAVGDAVVDIVTGGVVGGHLTVRGNSTVNFRGGAARQQLFVQERGTLQFFSGSHQGMQLIVEFHGMMRFFGGTVTNDLYLLMNGRLEMSGGSVGRLLVIESSSAFISGGAIRDEICAAGAACRIDLVGSELEIGTAANGQRIIKGVLVYGTDLGTHPSGLGGLPLRLVDGAELAQIVLHDARKMVIASEAETIDSTNSYPSACVAVSGTAEVAIRVGGEIGLYLLVQSRSIVDLDGGTVKGPLTVQDDAKLHVSGGAAEGDGVTIEDCGSMDMTDGSIAGFLSARDACGIQMSGGSVGESLVVSDQGSVVLSGGALAKGLILKGKFSSVAVRGTELEFGEGPWGEVLLRGFLEDGTDLGKHPSELGGMPIDLQAGALKDQIGLPELPHQVTITFDSLAMVCDTHEVGGFLLRSEPTEMLPGGTGNPAPCMFLGSTDTYAILSRIDGGAFDLVSIDIRELNGSLGPQTIPFAATRFGGESVNKTLRTDGPCCDGPMSGFETFSFDGSFRNLTEIRWGGEGAIAAYDNIVLRLTPVRLVPGDCNVDGEIDISDGLCLLQVLFLGERQRLPCGDGSSEDPANVHLLDWDADSNLDLSDAVGLLGWLFLGGLPHPHAMPNAEATAPIPIPDCL